MRHIEQAWAGIDAGKGHHHVVVIDRDGTRLLSRRVANTEPELTELIDTVTADAIPLTSDDVAPHLRLSGRSCGTASGGT